MADLFEKAAVKKVRFEAMQGNITAEDLFDIPMQDNMVGKKIKTSLEGLWMKLNKEVKEYDTTESPLRTKNSVNTDLKLKFDIVNRVMEIRMAKQLAREAAVGKKARNEQIMRLINDKENDALAGKSIEELRDLME